MPDVFVLHKGTYGLHDRVKNNKIWCERRKDIQAIHDFFREIGIPMTLREVGIDDSRLGEMAQHVALLEGLDRAWVPLYEQDILAIYKDCL